jgi:glucose-6-phosphate 1-dehydrogenase
MEPLTPEDVVYGQYGAGSIDGAGVPAYRDEDGVADDSETATFIALRARIANWRWQGVPFYIRTGKRMARRATQIVVTFRKAPVSVFQPFQDCDVASNTLVIQLQPDEGFTLSFEVKTPGDGIDVVTQELDFRYAEAFAPLPEAYVTLIQDIVQGDQTLFVHADEVEASWRTYQPILDADTTPAPYEAGSWGPEEASRLLEGGDHWPDPET